jgi:thioesterase domain-containing protein/acyl carrier protein
VVIVRDDISEETHMVAYIVLDQAGEEVDAKWKTYSIQQGLLNSLPLYMMPDDFVFVKSIPITPNGKIDRKLLPKPEFNLANLSGDYVAPRSDAEKLLANLWQEFMGIEKISVIDDFFTLGGHSLVAVQIMAGIEKATDKRLPLATLFEHSTIEKLALCLNMVDQSLKWNSLVPVKPKGSKTPLYIIHGEGLNVLCFNKLARNLDRDQPVYGLQARGLKGDKPLDTIEEMASNYINEVIAQNPEGPYLLAGYSFGGYIAVEMRRQMVEMGKTVQVIIFDTDAEKSKYKGWMYLLPKKIKRHLRGTFSFLKRIISHPAFTIKNILKALKKETSNKALSKTDSKAFYRQIQKIKDKLRVALGNYSLVPFEDTVYLFRAKTCTHYVEDTESLGWKKYATKGVEIFEVPGDHLSMLLSPNAEEFAASLQLVLDEMGPF